jgi:hypothetical protein
MYANTQTRTAPPDPFMDQVHALKSMVAESAKMSEQLITNQAGIIRNFANRIDDRDREIAVLKAENAQLRSLVESLPEVG